MFLSPLKNGLPCLVGYVFKEYAMFLYLGVYGVFLLGIG